MRRELNSWGTGMHSWITLLELVHLHATVLHANHAACRRLSLGRLSLSMSLQLSLPPHQLLMLR